MREKSRSKVSVKSNKGHYGCPSCGCADATVQVEISSTVPVMFSGKPVAESAAGHSRYLGTSWME